MMTGRFEACAFVRIMVRAGAAPMRIHTEALPAPLEPDTSNQTT